MPLSEITCLDCGSVGRPAGSLGAQSCVSQGQLVVICKACFLLRQLREFVPRIQSESTKSAVIDGLEALYALAKNQVEEELEASTSAASQ